MDNPGKSIAGAHAQLDRLQALRFIAAAAIVVRHVFMELEQHGINFPGREDVLAIPWGAGVDVFFVISGFVITFGAVGKGASAGAAGDFIVRRLIRLWPTYALFTALMLVAMAVVPSMLNHSTIDPAHTAASFAFIPWPEPGDAKFYPVLGQGWTLNYEMFFYVCFAATMLAPPRFRVAMLWAGGVALVAAGLIWRLPAPLHFYADPIVLEFLFGVALAVAYRRWNFRSSWAIGVAAAGFVALLVFATQWPDLHRAVKAGIPGLLIVAGVVFSGPTVERYFGCAPLATLGNASYALYLSHTFVVNLLLAIWLRLDVMNPWAFAVVASVGSVVASLVLYFLLEKPTLAFLKDKYASIRGKRGPVPATPASAPAP
ncbi:MAG: acyltransferase [Hyphomonadaceae bacterium]|nr:acyltransferase [Hyphomonadaceae bacterium]